MENRESIEILLVEDSNADAELILRALRKGNVATRVLRVRDGVEALELLFDTAGQIRQDVALPKLILLDLKMPRMNGIDVLKHLKSNDDTKRVPVVMLTSSAEQFDLVRAYDLGANSYLVKPVGFAAFTEIVNQIGLYWLVSNASCTGAAPVAPSAHS